MQADYPILRIYFYNLAGHTMYILSTAISARRVSQSSAHDGESFRKPINSSDEASASKAKRASRHPRLCRHLRKTSALRHPPRAILPAPSPSRRKARLTIRGGGFALPSHDPPPRARKTSFKRPRRGKSLGRAPFRPISTALGQLPIPKKRTIAASGEIGAAAKPNLSHAERPFSARTFDKPRATRRENPPELAQSPSYA